MVDGTPSEFVETSVEVNCEGAVVVVCPPVVIVITAVLERVVLRAHHDQQI